jgi:hypothetical protein
LLAKAFAGLNQRLQIGLAGGVDFECAFRHLAAPNPSNAISVRIFKHIIPLAGQAAISCVAGATTTKHDFTF